VRVGWVLRVVEWQVMGGGGRGEGRHGGDWGGGEVGNVDKDGLLDTCSRVWVNSTWKSRGQARLRRQRRPVRL